MVTALLECNIRTTPVKSGKVKFRLRKDIPREFLSDVRFPELPAIVAFLKPHDGEVFEGVEIFQRNVLERYLDYLEEHRIREGEDPYLRTGLETEKLPERRSVAGDPWDYSVYTLSSSKEERYEFGGLEKIGAER